MLKQAAAPGAESAGETWCIGALTTVLAMVLYLWSNSQAVYVHRGAVTDVSIAQEFAAQPLFFLRFLLKAVASSVIGVAQIQELEAGSPWFCPAASGVSAGAGSVCFVSAGTVSECAVSAL
ncbi:MAG: hypothetical protein ACLR8P_19370 [Clostridium fessum]